MIKKILYTLSIICLVILTIVTKNMLPLIFKTRYSGVIYLFFILMLLICELFALIKYKKVIKKDVSYNSFLIITTLYILIVYYRIYSINTSFNYYMELKSLRFNYILLSFALFVIIFDLYLSIKDYTRKVIK